MSKKWDLVLCFLAGTLIIVFGALAPINWILEATVYFIVYAVPVLLITWSIQQWKESRNDGRPE